MDEEKKTASNQPKTIAGFLIVISLITLIFGFWQLNNYLKSPFIISFETSADNLREQLTKVKSSTLSKYTDTDKDGLTDYNELNIYNTSPYLEDSDSDGISDFEEVNNGTNPSCPQGQDCELPTNTNYNVNSYFEDISGTDEEELLIYSIRQALLANGVTAEELSQIDDATLLEMYYDILAEEQGTTESNELALPEGVSKEDLENYSLDQIKQVMLTGGVSQEELDKIPNDELLAAWQEIISTL